MGKRRLHGVHPTYRNGAGTLLNGVCGGCAIAPIVAGHSDSPRQGTSGVVVIGTTRRRMRRCRRMPRRAGDQDTSRGHGIPDPRRHRHVPPRPRRRRRRVVVVRPDGQACETGTRPSPGRRDGRAALSAVTGRTHQTASIRRQRLAGVATGLRTWRRCAWRHGRRFTPGEWAPASGDAQPLDLEAACRRPRPRFRIHVVERLKFAPISGTRSLMSDR